MKKLKDITLFLMLTLAVFIMLPAKVRAADQTITRVQWLHDLTELFNMTVEEDNYPDNYFSDISEQDEYYRDVMVATEFGLVDVEAGYELKPQKPVTREFAAYTMNMCMGYVLDQNASYTFSDKTDFEHQDDEHYQSAQVAINRGWISVSGGKFNPGANLTQTEKNAMWSDAKKHMESEKIDEGYNNKVTFADGVIEIPKDTEYEFEEYDTGKFVTLFNYTGELEDGDTFALWVNGLPAIYKAVAVEDMGSGLVIQFQNGDENTAITEMDAQGTVEADLATAVQNGEGTMSWIAGGSEEKNYEDGREILDPRLAGNVAIKAIKRSIPVKLADGLSASISVTIPKPTVNYKVNGIQEVYVALNADTTAAVTVKGDAIENLGLPSSIDLVYIPIGGIGAARISISVAASGQCVLNYNFNAVAGVHYTRGGGTSLVTSFTKKSFTISAQAEISATVSATLGVTSIPKINASIWAKVGPRMGLNAWTYGDNKTPKACMDTYAYVYAGAGATLKVLSKDYSPKPYEIWTKNNSPVRVAAHYEDGRWVQACTRDASDRRYYTKMSSQYFSDPSGYYDSSNYSGNAASAVQPRYEYTLSKNEEGEDVATITKYYGTVSAITVPGVIDGYTVVAIGDGAFKGNRYLATAMLPDSVKEIGNDAFANSGLTSLTLPPNLEMMRGGILSGNTGVRELTIPKTVKVMQDKNLLPTGALNGSSVETVIFEKGITRIPSCGAKGAKKLTSVSIPETVTEIDAAAFQDCTALKTIDLPQNLATIGDNAFNNSGLTSLTLPSNLEVMGGGILSGNTGVRELTIPKTVKVMQDKNLLPTGALNGSSVETVIFEKGITRIPSCGAKGAKKLTSVSIPETVTEIGAEAFQDCTALKTIDLPQNLATIGDNAFDNSGLTSLTLPSNLEVMRGGILFGNTGVRELTIPKTVKVMQDKNLLPTGALNGSSVETVIFEKGITRIPSCGAKGAKKLTSVSIPETVTEIDAAAFQDCTALKTIDLPQNLTTIGNGAFVESGLTSLTLPNGVKKLGTYIFGNCIFLETMTLPDSITTIPNDLFAGCKNLKTINLSKNITRICAYSFKECDSLTEMTIPSGVTRIDEGAFFQCDSLKCVNLPDTLTNLGYRAFYNCDALTAVKIPNSVTDLGNQIFYDCDALTDVTLGTKLKKLPDSTFEHCDALVSVTLPYGIQSIGNSAFKTDISLTSVTIPRSTTSIGSSVFSYPEKMTIYGVAGTYAETYANENGIKFVSQEINASKVTLNQSSVTINKRKTYALKLTVEPSDCTDEVIWKSTNSDVASVDGDGLITAKAIGTATIRVTVGKVKATCAVKVVQPVTSISLNKSNLTMNATETYQLSAKAYPETAENTEIDWKSEDETIASVDQNGMVMAKKKGSTNIVAEAKDGSGVTGKCRITVNNTAYFVKSIDELESPHNYSNNSSDIWIYTAPASQNELTITFDERTEVEEDFDYIYLLSGDGTEVGKYTGTQLSGKTIKIPGNMVKIKLVSDDAGTEWGFKVKSINEKPKLTVALSADPVGSIVSGSQVRLIAEASGGSGKYTYKFLVCDDKDNWYRIQDYGTSNTCTWIPGTAGKKTLYVDVKDSDGSIKRAELLYEVKNKEVPLTVKFTASPSASAASGSEVKLTAEVSGGNGKYTYKFLVCDDKDNWYRIQDYGTSNTCTWVPGATGKKMLYADVKDSNGSVKRAGLSYEIKNKEVPLTVKFTASPSASTISGSQVKLIAEASGGSGKYTYKFIVYSKEGGWYKLRDFAESNTYIWNTGASGDKILYVDVKDSNGSVKRAELSYEIKDKEVPLTVKLIANPSTSVTSGSEVKLTAEASGGSGKYTYKFLVCDDKNNWYKIQDYGISNICTWIPGATGKKTLYVDAKDSTGTVKRTELGFEVLDPAKVHEGELPEVISEEKTEELTNAQEKDTKELPDIQKEISEQENGENLFSDVFSDGTSPDRTKEETFTSE